MAIKVYIASITPLLETRKRIQRVLMLLDGSGAEYECIDLSQPGMEDNRQFVRDNGKTRNGASFPGLPQVFCDDVYCGDYLDFDEANECGTLQVFLKQKTEKEVEQETTATIDGVSAELTNGYHNDDAEGADECGDVTANVELTETPNDEGDEEVVVDENGNVEGVAGEDAKVDEEGEEGDKDDEGGEDGDGGEDDEKDEENEGGENEGDEDGEDEGDEDGENEGDEDGENEGEEKEDKAGIDYDEAVDDGGVDAESVDGDVDDEEDAEKDADEENVDKKDDEEDVDDEVIEDDEDVDYDDDVEDEEKGAGKALSAIDVAMLELLQGSVDRLVGRGGTTGGGRQLFGCMVADEDDLKQEDCWRSDPRLIMDGREEFESGMIEHW